MKVLLTGANGQLGYELKRTCPANVTLLATDVSELDITKPTQIAALFAKERPDLVINGAAYTAVDLAETQPELADLINHQATGYLAKNAAEYQARFMQISTDFIFAGQNSVPYSVDSPAQPLSVYGETKWRGEQVVRENCPNHLIVRTSWLYSAHGNNFVKTMLKLMSNKESLGIIYDQVGTPTWARTLATMLWQVADKPVTGTLHCSDNGVASWYDFAVAIQDEALSLGLLNKAIPVHAIPTSAYPTPAQRPAFSVMDKSGTEQCLGYTLPHWRHSLRAMLRELVELNH